MNSKNILIITILLFTSIVFISCSEDDTTSPQTNTAPLAKFSDIKAKVFTNCLGAQCHSTSGNANGLILESNVAYSELVGVQSLIDPTLKRVEAGNSANSVLVKILKGDIVPRMPKDGNALSSATIDSIAKWIDNGAPND
jgi:hypothetical protein